MKYRFIACLLGAGVFLAPSRAQLFTFNFSDVVSGASATSAGSTAGNVVFSSFTASGVGAASNASGVFSFTSWTTGASNGSNTFTGGINLADYFQFTITPAAGFSLTLANLSFSAGRTSTGPRQFSIRSSLDSFSSNLAASATDPNVSIAGGNVFQFIDNTSTALFTGDRITLGGANFTDLTGPVTFRIYGFNAESAAGGFRIDDFGINGSVTALSAVPEPASTAAVAGALAFAFAWRRRCRLAPNLAVIEK